MLDICMTLLFFAVGAILGSFGCCQVWRIRNGDKSKRSHCLHCKYRLKWYDNVPILSWLLLGGKCRKCHKKIGYAEILSEFFGGVVFALSYWLWPGGLSFVGDVSVFALMKFGLYSLLLTIFVILFVYDAKWKEMPTSVLWGACGVGVAYCFADFLERATVGGGVVAGDFIELLGAIGVLPGFYFLMYRVSDEKWVGGGDWILCLPIALVLGNIWLALFALFGSNLLGSFVMVPLASAKKKKKMKIPFGPFLIVAFLLVFWAQDWIMEFVGL